MLWEVEIRPRHQDPERDRVIDTLRLLTHRDVGDDLVTATSRGYLLEGDLDEASVERLMQTLLVDAVVESGHCSPLSSITAANTVTVLLKPGVMDPVAQSVIDIARDLGVVLTGVRTFRRYYGRVGQTSAETELLHRRILANEAIEQIVLGSIEVDHLSLGSPYTFQRIEVQLVDLDAAGLEQLSREGQLALNLEEMRAIQQHFQRLGRQPTDVELETLAQTWSEHCSHKTLKGPIRYTETVGDLVQTKHFRNLLKETIFAATQEIRRRLGDADWCVSVFSDNAGVIRFNDTHDVCFKVETHNHPSAIEPYGGANTGLGGVIRDPLGTGLGAKPICNTDVFCFAPPDYPLEELPQGVLHPRRVMEGVVAGVRDYGNRMGIPTVNGAILFDARYLANPLVFCGTVGLMPIGTTDRNARAGDLIVAVGGRTGRDGIHGATFSSLELTSESESVSGGAVQIGNAITEKKLLDVILAARDRALFSAITDCGAGGFSSAIGEMGAELGATVHLERAPSKYAGLSYTEIWISESQERMVLAVPPENWPALNALCQSEDVEAAALGEFSNSGRLQLYYDNHLVGDLAMDFLHQGRPEVLREATWEAPSSPPPPQPSLVAELSAQGALLAILRDYSVSSKEWVIRQYDHEVQAGSVIKPLVGVHEDGPSDAAVVLPVLGEWTGLAVGCGLNPAYADLDPYAAAACAIDEAVRNVVAVGADPSRIAILDNFCWGNVKQPAVLGSLVRTAEACRDIALAYGTPFISGKDSLNNEFRTPERTISIPPTLLISALGRVPDVRRCVSMDLKSPGNRILVVGVTRDEFGGSFLQRIQGLQSGIPPQVDPVQAPMIFAALHQAIVRGFVRACHDLSDGGLSVAIAEMALAGGIGVEISELQQMPVAGSVDAIGRLFSESPTRFLIEVSPSDQEAVLECFANLPIASIGRTLEEPQLRVADHSGQWLIHANLSELKEAWQRPLRW